MKKDVFIVGVKSVFPKLYDTVHVIDKLYSKKFASDRVNKFATRLGVNTQIKNRAISIDLEQFPKKVVALDDSPVVWAKNIIHDISKQSNFPIEFLSVSYNTSSHEIAIPNLSCQIAHACDLDLEIPPQEIANYGCASGIFLFKMRLIFVKRMMLWLLLLHLSNPRMLLNRYMMKMISILKRHCVRICFSETVVLGY